MKPPFAVHRVDERSLAFAVVGRHRHHLVERRAVGALLQGPEVLAETLLAQRPVGDGQRQRHGLFFAIGVQVGQFVFRPGVFRRRVALQVQALGKGIAGVRVEHQVRHGAAFQRHARGLGRAVLGDAPLARARRVQDEQRRAAFLQALQQVFEQVRGRRLRGLHHEGAAVGHRDQRQFLAALVLQALAHPLVEGLGRLALETGRAGLAAAGGVGLGVDHDHAHRLAGRHQARQVLEADVHHRAVAAHREQRRTQREFLVAELLPAEVGEEGLVGGLVVTVFQQLAGAANGDEAVGHLAHVTLEQAHGQRGRVLEQVAGPGERIGIEGEGRAPHRGAAGGVGEAHARPATATRALLVTPLQVFQGLDGPVDAGDARLLVGFERHFDAGLVPGDSAEIRVRSEQAPGLFVQVGDELRDFTDVLGRARRHQGVDGRNHQVERGLLAAAHAGAVTAQHGAVVALFQQQRRHHADALVQAGDADVAVVGFRQVPPQRPVGFQHFLLCVGLVHGHQRAVVADRDAHVAALAGLGIDRDGQQATTALLLALRHVEERRGAGQRDVFEGRAHRGELGVVSGAFFLVPLHFIRKVFIGLRENLLKCFKVLFAQQPSRFARQVAEQLAELGQRLLRRGDRAHGRVQHFLDAADHARDGRVGALHPALAAAGALVRHEARHQRTHGGHVAHAGRGGGDCAQGGERVGQDVVAGLVLRTDLVPEGALVAGPFAGVDARHFDRDQRDFRAAALVGEAGHVDRPGLVETPQADVQVVLELGAVAIDGEVGAQGGEQVVAVGALATEQLRGVEERAHERQ